MANYKRILLKLSGESLMGEKQYGIDEKRLAEYAAQIKEIHEMGIQIGIVIGGGNIFRGLSGANKGFDHGPCHHRAAYAGLEPRQDSLCNRQAAESAL